jgi:hypothetical protein
MLLTTIAQGAKGDDYLYPSSFVVQILISQTWMSFHNLMDNEIMIIRENTMMGPKWFLKFCLRNHFHEQC